VDAGRIVSFAGDKALAEIVSGRAAKNTAAKSQIATLTTALNLFEVNCGRSPTTEEGLNALLVAPDGLKSWAGLISKFIDA